MPKKKNPKPRTRFRTSAAAARHRRAQRRRGILSAVVVVVIIAIVGIIAFGFVGTGTKSATTSSTSAASTTTTAASTTTASKVPSVAGKPCVATKGPLPAGAPAVPVKVGPPPTALVTQDLKPGTGAVVKAGQTLTVDYIGVACSTGKIFDSSYSRKQPATFPLGQVIPGWQQGLPGMKVGGERLLAIPPAEGYGTQGSPPDIAPGETLWFVVHVRSAK